MQNIKDAQVELINKFKNYLVKFDRNFFKPEKIHYFTQQLIVSVLGLIFYEKNIMRKKVLLKI